MASGANITEWGDHLYFFFLTGIIDWQTVDNILGLDHHH